MTELQTTPRPRRPRPAVVTLTEAAAERVRILTEAGGHKALRVGLKNAGCAGQEYTFALADEIGPLDEVVTDKGATVVVEPDFNRANQIQLCTSRSAPTPFFKSGSCK